MDQWLAANQPNFWNEWLKSIAFYLNNKIKTKSKMVEHDEKLKKHETKWFEKHFAPSIYVKIKRFSNWISSLNQKLLNCNARMRQKSPETLLFITLWYFYRVLSDSAPTLNWMSNAKQYNDSSCGICLSFATHH